MQALKRVPHPSGVDIIFDAKWHQYKLGHTRLQSVSKVLDKYFPFDEERILALVSRKKQLPVAEIKQQWQRQALLGKNVHEYIECKLLDRPPPTFLLLLEAQKRQRKGGAVAMATATAAPVDNLLHGEEELYLPVADAAVAAVRSAYHVLGVEQVIAAPDWGVAGTVDFIGLNKKDPSRLLIGDWKTSGSVTSNFRFGSFETPGEGCMRHLPNAKFYRYATQVIMYGEIIKKERYVEKGFFDDMLSAVVGKGAGEGEAAGAGGAKKKTSASATRGGKGKKKATKGKGGLELAEGGDAAAAPAALDLSAFHRGEFSLEYGIVQLSKNDEGGVEAEFKEVTEQTVLPPDAAEMTFNMLLRRALAGE